MTGHSGTSQSPTRYRTIGALARLLQNAGVSLMTKMPPVPPQNRSPKGVGSQKNTSQDEDPKAGRRENLAEQGRQGNIKQNTTNQGYQQDR